VTVEANGFKRLALKGNPVNVGQPTTVNATLEVGGAQEVVEVTGAAERIQTSSSGNLGNLVEQQTIVALPIVGARGRNPLEFINFSLVSWLEPTPGAAFTCMAPVTAL
jgi:hypothetical protein